MSVAQTLPLQLRLIASVAVALLITAGLSVVPLYWHAKSKVTTEMQAALAIGRQVAENEIHTNESPQTLTQRLHMMVAHYNGDRHLKAKLESASGTLVASSRLAPPDNSAPAWFRRFIDVKPHVTQLSLQEPVSTIHRVVIEADPTNEIGEAWEDVTTFAGVLGLFCLLVLGSVSWIVTRAITPIQSLLSGYADIGRGNLKTRITPSGSPELQQLCHGFNEMGGALQNMAERNDRLARQLEDVQEEERADLARDLHDEVSPLLFAADVDATMIEKLAREDGNTDIVAQTNAIRGALKQLKKTVTFILGRLRPAVLLDQGLRVAIDNLVSTSARRHRDVKFSVNIEDINAPANITSVIFFIVREAVANALRHGKPKSVSIDVHTNGKNNIEVLVTDDGTGLANAELNPGFGIRGMSERVGHLNGTLSITQIQTGGVQVKVLLPNSDAIENVSGNDKGQSPLASQTSIPQTANMEGPEIRS